MNELKIVEGGWYQTRRGDVYGPLQLEKDEPVFIWGANKQTWTQSGKWLDQGDNDCDLIRRVNPPTDYVDPVTAAIPWDQPERLRVNGHKVTQIDPITIVGAPAFMVAWGEGSNQRAQWFRPDGKDEVYKITVDPVVAFSATTQASSAPASITRRDLFAAAVLAGRLAKGEPVNGVIMFEVDRFMSQFDKEGGK